MHSSLPAVYSRSNSIIGLLLIFLLPEWLHPVQGTACNISLGIGDGQLPAQFISASSTKRGYRAADARTAITIGKGAWCAGSSSSRNDFWQVDFEQVVTVTGVVTRGEAKPLSYSGRVTSYRLMYSNMSTGPFHVYRHANTSVPHVFPGNANTKTAQYNALTTAVRCRVLRLTNLTNSGNTGWNCIRVDVLGCPVPRVSQKYQNEQALGMESDKIPDDAITSNSEHNSKLNAAHLGRLNQNRGYGGWCSSASAKAPYLAIDFGRATSVTAVATQGVADTQVGGSFWVKSYELEFASQPNGTWQKVMNTVTGKPQRFTANADTTTVVKQRLARPVVMWSIRFTSLESSTVFKCMRVEVYGWENTATVATQGTENNQHTHSSPSPSTMPPSSRSPSSSTQQPKGEPSSPQAPTDSLSSTAEKRVATSHFTGHTNQTSSTGPAGASTPKSSSSSSGTIAGIVIAVLVTVLVAIVAGYYIRRRQELRREKNPKKMRPSPSGSNVMLLRVLSTNQQKSTPGDMAVTKRSQTADSVLYKPAGVRETAKRKESDNVLYRTASVGSAECSTTQGLSEEPNPYSEVQVINVQQMQPVPTVAYASTDVKLSISNEAGQENSRSGHKYENAGPEMGAHQFENVEPASSKGTQRYKNIGLAAITAHPSENVEKTTEALETQAYDQPRASSAHRPSNVDITTEAQLGAYDQPRTPARPSEKEQSETASVPQSPVYAEPTTGPAAGSQYAELSDIAPQPQYARLSPEIPPQLAEQH